MKKLEKQIIRKVYVFETKKFIFELFSRVIIVAGAVSVGLFFGQLLFTQFNEQQTLDVLQILNEDIQIIKEYWTDVISVLFEETPKDILLIIILSFVLFALAILTLIKNFEKIKAKFISLSKFWWHRA
ncbi:MAG: hypothetical protein HYW86_00955 [Candidatus Roizmanbacteria bacterium]|nr:MAG: hypothetical protein HYW86_00955 [Candidatus Roizmanbacteria bacterium]